MGSPPCSTEHSVHGCASTVQFTLVMQFHWCVTIGLPFRDAITTEVQDVSVCTRRDMSSAVMLDPQATTDSERLQLSV